MPLQRVRDAEPDEKQVVKWTTEGAVKCEPDFICHDDHSDHCIIDSQSILQREGIRQLPGI